jgi:diguanylate cyclase (GGDEF)-like protein
VVCHPSRDAGSYAARVPGPAASRRSGPDILAAVLRQATRVEILPLAVRILGVVLALVAVTAAEWLSGDDVSMVVLYAGVVAAAVFFLPASMALVLPWLAAAGSAGAQALGDHPPGSGLVLLNALLRGLALTLVAVITISASRLLDELGRAAGQDPLTGCLSRRSFLERLSIECDRARRSGGSLALASFHLDDPKAVNDNEGHAAGDALLVRFGRTVTERIRRVDALGRLGGDEFALLVPDADATQARHLLERLMADPGLPPASCGLAVFERTAPTPGELLQRADELMYEAKSAGGPVIRIFG